MKKELTCIICPNGCELQVEWGNDGLLSLEGNLCPRGKEYAVQEMTAPMRTISSSVLVEGGVMPLASVRLTRPVPRERIPEIMQEIRKIRLTAPVTAGQVVVQGIAGLDSDLISTREVGKRKR